MLLHNLPRDSAVNLLIHRNDNLIILFNFRPRGIFCTLLICWEKFTLTLWKLERIIFFLPPRFTQWMM